MEPLTIPPAVFYPVVLTAATLAAIPLLVFACQLLVAVTRRGRQRLPAVGSDGVRHFVWVYVDDPASVKRFLDRTRRLRAGDDLVFDGDGVPRRRPDRPGNVVLD